jgi:hypothetical protein
MISMHPSSLRQLYTSSLGSNASDPEAKADLDPLRKDLTDGLWLNDTGGSSDSVHQLETPKLSIHQVLMPWMKTTNNDNNPSATPELDLLASSVVKVSGSGSGSEESVGKATT